MSWNVESPRRPFGWAEPPKALALTDDGGGCIVYVPERTCEWIWGEDWFESSTEGPRELHWANWYLDCGCWEGDEDEFCDFDDPEARPDGGWAFCPNCGAKVVGE